MPSEEAFDFWESVHEIPSEVWKRRLADDDEQFDVIANNCFTFVHLVANAGIMGDGNPLPFSNDSEPLFVRTVRREVTSVPLDGQACSEEDIRKLIAQVAVREENGQAARS